MNIKNIFVALKNDEDNSALGIIVGELENQGYKVKLNDREVSSEGIFNEEYSELEELQELTITLRKDDVVEQEFMIEFVEFHEFIIKEKKIE